MWQTQGLDKLIKSIGLISLLLFSYGSLAAISPPPPSSDSFTIDEPYNGSGTHRVSTDGTWNITWSNISRSYINTWFEGQNVTYVLEELAEAGGGDGVYGEIYGGSGRSKTISGKRISGNYFYRIKVCGNYGCSSYTAAKKVELRYEHPSTLNLPSSDSDGSFDISWTQSVPGRYFHFRDLQRQGPIYGNDSFDDNASWTHITRFNPWQQTTSHTQYSLLPGKYRYRLVEYHRR